MLASRLRAIFRTSALLGLIATLPWIAPSRASSPEWTPMQLLQAVQLLEQVGISRRHHEEFAALLDLRMQRLSRIATEAFTQETGLSVGDKPGESGWSAQEMSQWVRLLRSRSPEQRCELLRLAYAVSISRLTLMKASVPEPPSFPLKTEQAASSEFAADTERALWELRFFWALPPESPLAPQKCVDSFYPAYSILHEAHARVDFLQSGATTPKVKFRRWPLGRAAKMCGRPFITHYVDHLAFETPGREIDPRPMSLMGIEDREAFEREIGALERSVLSSPRSPLGR